jgi:hypothetical protein
LFQEKHIEFIIFVAFDNFFAKIANKPRKHNIHEEQNTLADAPISVGWHVFGNTKASGDRENRESILSKSY